VKNCHALKSQVKDVKNLTKSNNHQINNMSDIKESNDVNRINEVNISNKKNMTLKEKFKEILTAFWINVWEDECEKVADEFAIGFAEWLLIIYNEDIIYDAYTKEELLEIYKEEKGL